MPYPPSRYTVAVVTESASLRLNAARSRLRGLAATFGKPGTGRTIASTAGFNLAIVGTAGLGGVILARTVGPTVRGEYAAITAWLDVAMVIGQFGQPAALCYYVASDPLRARRYVATSRVILLTVGLLVLAAGLLLTPTLARGQPELAEGYRIALAAFAAMFAGCSYVSALQARDLNLWNLVRASQPTLGLLAFGALWSMRLLTLRSALTVIVVTLLVQACLAYRCCRCRGLAPGSSELVMFRPLAAYGVAQLASLAPATLNSQLGQIVLSQTVPLADLGRYAVALSLTLLPMPLVSAIGNVAFPRLAARSTASEAPRRRQVLAIVGSARHSRRVAGAAGCDVLLDDPIDLRPALPGRCALAVAADPGRGLLRVRPGRCRFAARQQQTGCGGFSAGLRSRCPGCPHHSVAAFHWRQRLRNFLYRFVRCRAHPAASLAVRIKSESSVPDHGSPER